MSQSLERLIRGSRYIARLRQHDPLEWVSGENMDCPVVEIFGPNQSLYELAQQIGTIPYEILTSVSDRVKRVYNHH